MHRPTFIPALSYRDPIAALKWLENAFGFETSMLITGPSGEYQADMFHAEMSFGDAVVMIGGEWSEQHKSPKSVGGACTQAIHVGLTEDVNAHCARARAAGAVIVRDLNDEFYGARTYTVADLEGHLWSFAQAIKEVSRADAEKASGLKITAESWK